MMGFLDSLRRVLHQDAASPPSAELATVWGLSVNPADPGSAPLEATTEDASVYDRAQWQKKMKRLLDELPASEPDWAELMSDARALHFDKDWITRCQVEEFLLLIRRAVSDGHFTEQEHRKLDLARDLIGIPEAEAEAALHSIIAEAESFFGKSVDGA